MISALCAMGLVLRTQGGLRVSEDAAAYLTRGTPGSLWGLVDMEVDHFLSPRALMDALEKDDSSVYGEADPWEAHDADPERARAFTAAMHSVSANGPPRASRSSSISPAWRACSTSAAGAARSPSRSAARTRRYARPSSTSRLWSPWPASTSRTPASPSGSTSRSGTCSDPPLPAGHDAVLYSQILHDWGFEKGADLLARAFEALPPGGQVLVHEKLVEDGADAPLANALVHLDMLVWTEGQQYRLRRAGRDADRRRLRGRRARPDRRLMEPRQRPATALIPAAVTSTSGAPRRPEAQGQLRALRDPDGVRPRRPRALRSGRSAGSAPRPGARRRRPPRSIPRA